MTINIFVLKGDLDGENRSGAFLFFLSGIFRQEDTPVVYRVLCFAITDNNRI